MANGMPTANPATHSPRASRSTIHSTGARSFPERQPDAELVLLRRATL